jgi:hypothetical protein
MPEPEFTNPSIPFLELWSFRVTLSSTARDPNQAKGPWQIRDHVIQQLREGRAALTKLEGQPGEIWNEINEIVTDHLSSPDYRFFITEYEERPGSWEIAFLIVGAFYGGVCGYGAFRQGLEYVYSDLKALFATIDGVKARVRKRFKERHVMAKPRIEPTVDWNKTDIKP